MRIEYVVAHHVCGGIAHLVDSVFATVSTRRRVRASIARRQAIRRPRVYQRGAADKLFVRLDLSAFTNKDHGAIVAE